MGTGSSRPQRSTGNGYLSRNDVNNNRRIHACNCVWCKGRQAQAAVLVGRSNRADPEKDKKEFDLEKDDKPTVPVVEYKPELIKDDDPETVLRVKKLDALIEVNTKAHFTDEYDITEKHTVDDKERDPQLVVRRGQSFDIILELDRDYDEDVDLLRLEFSVKKDSFESGKGPQESNGTKIVVQVTKTQTKAQKVGLFTSWIAYIKESKDKKLKISITPGPDAIIAVWNIAVISMHSKLKEGEQEKLLRYSWEKKFYLLFNAWCQQDSVYLEDEDWRDECVLNDSGKIYSGTYKKIGAKVWYFGQFEEIILDCCMYLLDKVGLSWKSRGNPVLIARKLSSITNDIDNNGVLVGNWSGDYSDGARPTSWKGSVKILKQFYETQSPVLFGQCWVFSGVMTTICRALGMPARSVTNFRSAHDTDESMTIDVYWQDDGTPIEKYNDDSIWNFHVWNEVWMRRLDLDASNKYGGWQAIDATPQETSDGLYQCGPMSLVACKEGSSALPYDGMFIFAEVNSDKCHHIKDKFGMWRYKFDKKSVGKNISTKNCRRNPKPPAEGALKIGGPDRYDVTHLYKYPEGSKEEREAVKKAQSNSETCPPYTRDGDVDFDLVDNEMFMYGQDFKLKAHLKSDSKEKRTVNVKMTLISVTYTGVRQKMIDTFTDQVVLKAGEERDVVMNVAANKYLGKVDDEVGFKVYLSAHTEETNALEVHTDDFRLVRPDIEIECNSNQRYKKPFECKVTFTNPLPTKLTGCEFSVEGTVVADRTYKVKDLGPNEGVSIGINLSPFKTGSRQITFGFNANEINNISGYKMIDVSR